jgi:alpha-1,6-mannosyltransferase
VTARPALVAGLATACLVGTASLLAWRAGSPLVPRDGGTAEQGSAWWFLVLLVLAFACYLGGLALLRRATPALRAVAVVAVLVQLVPLGAPLLLSTDAWTYWSYGWIASEGGGNPYVDAPSEFPENPAGPYMGAAWRDTTTVYGPVFTGVSEPIATVAGSSSDAAAWLYKCLAALGLLAACAAVAASSGRSSLAVAFVGWNPVLAVHAAGGGHNDALVGGLAALAVALALRRRHDLSGAVWVLAVLVKWVPLVFLALASVGARARARPLGVRGVVGAAVLLSALATWLYGVDWLRAAEPLAGNAARETSYALPSRLEQLGVPHGVALGACLAALVAGLLWLAREATRGRVRLGLAACLVLLTTPYLAVWYLAWAVPLAAPDEERASRLAALALTAYLLPQTIPL